MVVEMQDRRTKSVTIYDVAAEAGVAASTVSRAFSRPGRVSAETVAKVREAADKLGYKERTTASRATPSATRRLLVTVGGLGNLFYHQTLEGIEDVATAEGYSVFLTDGRAQTEYERATLEPAVENADAVIMISPRVPDAVLLNLARRRPLVVVNRIVRDVHCIIQNVPDGMRQVLTHLTDLGHRSVTFIAAPPEQWIQNPRWDSLSHRATELGMSVHRIGPFEASIRGGLHAADAWMTNRTSAVVAYNDDMAFGFMRTLLERGVRIPADVSVVGIDNSAMAPLFIPSLTSLALPGHGQGELAAKMILELVAGRTPPTTATVVPMRLIVRGSTGPANTVAPS